MKQSFYNLNFEDLEKYLYSKMASTTAASLMFNHYYKKKNTEVCRDNIAKRTLKLFENDFHFNLPEIDTVFEASDKTVKFLFKLHDSNKVECVLIPFNNKYSVCLSSQVGCAMNCSFCYTGTQGLTRNLETYEIVGQFLEAYRWLIKNRGVSEKILNIVFMGQGEPLHNFDAVKKSCEIFLCPHGTSVGIQKISISTSGYIPGLKRWADEIPGVNLALSLHSPFKAIRDELIPINKKFDLSEVLEIIDAIPLQKKQFVTYEYLLIDGFNDGDHDAHATGELLKDKCAYINLIPFNPFPGSEYKRPNVEKVQNFKVILDTYKIPTLIRMTKGDDVLAACGQLNTK